MGVATLVPRPPHVDGSFGRLCPRGLWSAPACRSFCRKESDSHRKSPSHAQQWERRRRGTSLRGRDSRRPGLGFPPFNPPLAALDPPCQRVTSEICPNLMPMPLAALDPPARREISKADDLFAGETGSFRRRRAGEVTTSTMIEPGIRFVTLLRCPA